MAWPDRAGLEAAPGADHPSIAQLCAELVAVSADLATGLRQAVPTHVFVDALLEAPTRIVLCRNEPGYPIFFANECFLRETGYARGEVLDQSCLLLEGPDTDPDAVRRIRDALRDGRAHVETLLNYRRDGTAFRSLLHIVPIRRDGQAYAFMGILHVAAKSDGFARGREDAPRTG